jgi:hypothetical protein
MKGPDGQWSRILHPHLGGPVQRLIVRVADCNFICFPFDKVAKTK